MVADPAADRSGEHRLGILFVHGIGTQLPREILVRWGDALIGILAEVTRPLGAGDPTPEGAGMPLLRVEVARASAGDGSADAPAEVTLTLTAPGGQPESWLLRECWWADAFPPPTYRELVSWSARSLPWSIALHVAQRYWQQKRARGSRLRVGAALLAAVRLLALLALSPLIVLALAVVLLLGLLPIAQWRSIVLAAQSTLTATVGDSLAFVESPVRAALIRARILDAVARLRGSCERIIVVAHSQGAAVVHEALGGMAAVGGETSVQAPAAAPDTLLTFGAGINKLVALKAARSIVAKDNPVTSVLFVLGLTAALAVAIALSLSPGEVSGEQVALSFGLFTGCTLVVAALVAAVKRMKRRWPRWGALLWSSVAILSLAAGAAAFVLVRRLQLPWLLPLSLVGALAALAGAVRNVLGEKLRAALAARVRRPPGVSHWVDLYAAADPVPNGPVFVAEREAVESVRVWTAHSVLGDHTSYWSYRDEFVLRVLRECAATAESPWRHRLPTPGAGGGDALPVAELRVRDLRWARALHRLAWLAVLVLLWRRAGALLPLPVEVAAGLPDWAATAARPALLVAAVAAAAAVTEWLLREFWQIRVRSEQRACLAGQRAPTTWGYLLSERVWLGYVVGFPVLIAQALFAADDVGGTLDSFLESLDASLTEVSPNDGPQWFFVYGLAFAVALGLADALGRWWRRRAAKPGSASADTVAPGEDLERRALLASPSTRRKEEPAMSEGSEGPRAAHGLEAAREQRNLLERLIARIPGFGGFQERELRRDVDKLQREHLAEAVHRVKRRARDAARAYTDAGQIGVLDRFDRLDRRLDRLGESIRFADYGATGLFAVEKVGEEELGRIYEFDLALLDDLDALTAEVDELPPPDGGDPGAALDAVLARVDAVAEKWSRRDTEISRVVQTGR